MVHKSDSILEPQRFQLSLGFRQEFPFLGKPQCNFMLPRTDVFRELDPPMNDNDSPGGGQVVDAHHIIQHIVGNELLLADGILTK